MQEQRLVIWFRKKGGKNFTNFQYCNRKDIGQIVNIFFSKITLEFAIGTFGGLFILPRETFAEF